MKRKKKLLSALLTLAMVLTLLTAAALTALADADLSGSGTAADPYQIGSKAQLEKFRDIVNGANGESRNAAACAVLTADIDLGGAAWTPMGDETRQWQYTGTFDGAGFAISGLSVTGGFEFRHSHRRGSTP
ncbi:MAG: hypothetical protein IKO91_05370 [Oscillospiraceae bacterium]|nr:hypothetical protein [Oscillospiraceae bacterium]